MSGLEMSYSPKKKINRGQGRDNPRNSKKTGTPKNISQRQYETNKQYYVFALNDKKDVDKQPQASEESSTARVTKATSLGNDTT